MKKFSAIVFALVLVFCLLPGSVFAVGALPQPDSYDYGALPQPDSYDPYGAVDSGWTQADSDATYNYPVSASIPVPVITYEPSDLMGTMGGVPDALTVTASTAVGSLHYQWYAADVNSSGTLTAIPGACAASYSPAQTAGTAYYCVGVYCVVGNERGVEVQSRLIAVNYSGIQIISAPSRTSYTQGESVSLKGLTVRIFDVNGNYWDSTNGSGLSVNPSKLDSAGRVAVDVSYGMSTATFYVNVAAGASDKAASAAADGDAAADANDPNHVHEYGEWTVTKEASCVTTGIQTRACACGETQTEVIAKTDHAWDEGVITKQPTATTNGSRLYTCTVCKANKSEIIAAGTDTSGSAQGLTVGTAAASTTPAPTPTSGMLTANDVGASGDTGAMNVGTVNRTDSTAWWLIPVSALLLVACGSGAYVLMKKKGGE